MIYYPQEIYRIVDLFLSQCHIQWNYRQSRRLLLVGNVGNWRKVEQNEYVIWFTNWGLGNDWCGDFDILEQYTKLTKAPCENQNTCQGSRNMWSDRLRQMKFGIQIVYVKQSFRAFLEMFYRWNEMNRHENTLRTDYHRIVHTNSSYSLLIDRLEHNNKVSTIFRQGLLHCPCTVICSKTLVNATPCTCLSMEQ